MVFALPVTQGLVPSRTSAKICGFVESGWRAVGKCPPQPGSQEGCAPTSGLQRQLLICLSSLPTSPPKSRCICPRPIFPSVCCCVGKKANITSAEGDPPLRGNLHLNQGGLKTELFPPKGEAGNSNHLSSRSGHIAIFCKPIPTPTL